jgi:hypothetical protein
MRLPKRWSRGQSPSDLESGAAESAPQPFSDPQRAPSERDTSRGLTPGPDGNGRGAGLASLPGRGRLGWLRREPWVVLLPLVGVQWLAILIFALSVPRNGWLFYQGGDQTFFYTDSWVLAHGHIPESKVGYAWSLLLAPFPALFGPSFLAAVPAIVILQVLVLAPIALLAVYGIGARSGGRAVGYGAAGLWVFAPFLSIPLFVDRYHEKFVEQFLPQALGLTGLGDYPSTVALLVSAYFLVRCLDTRAPAEAVLAGLAAGFAVGIKPANALFLGGPALAFLVARRWRDGTAFAAALVPAAVALAIWKARGLGYLPLLTPDSEALAAGVGAIAGPGSPPLGVVVSRYLELDWDRLHANYLYLREVFWSTRLVQWLPVAGLLAVARLSWPKALLLGGWLATFVLVKGSSTEASLEQGTLLRLIMPALPPFLLLAAAIPLLVPQVGPRIAARFPCRTRALRPRSMPVLAGVAAFGLLPVAVLAFLPPLQDGRAATLSSQSVYVPVGEEFGLRSAPSAAGGGIDLAWRPRASGSTRVFYTLYRAPAEFRIPKGSPEDFPLVREGLLCESRRGGADKCSIEMDPLATTREPRWHDAPPPGRWTYRVGIAANWVDDEGRGDTMLLSRPHTATVR